MAHPFQKHRESQREAGEDRYRKSGGRAPKSKHVSKHIHITVNKGGPGDLAGMAPPAGPMPAGAGPIPGAPSGGPMPMPPPGGMPPPPGATPPMKRGGKT